MKEKLIELLKVKSIITILVAGVFTYLAVTKVLPIDKTMEIILLVFTFYFAKQQNQS